MAGAGVLQRSHSWSIANCEEIMTLLCVSDYLCVYVCCFCSPSVGLKVFCLRLHLPYETQETPVSAERRIRICLSPGKSASNSGGEVGIQHQESQVYFLPKGHQGSMKKLWEWEKIQWETLCYTSVCPLPNHGGTELLAWQGLGRGWSIFTYSTINSKGHKCWCSVCSTQPWKDGVPASLLGCTASL